MFIAELSESAANTIHAWANVALVVGAVLALVGTLGVFWSGGIRDKYADRRLSDNATETARANEAASHANERAASLEKEAADAKLELERLRSTLAWRTLSEAQQQSIARKMAAWAKIPVSNATQSVAVFSTNGSLESAKLADQIADALGPNGAGFSINRYPVTYSPMGTVWSVAGVALLIGKSARGEAVANALVEALTEQKIATSIIPKRRISVCPDEQEANGEPSCSAVSIMVGDRL